MKCAAGVGGDGNDCIDGKELEEHPCGKAGNDWWHTPVFWLCRDKPGKHHVTIETLPAEAGGEAGFRLAVLMVQR